MVTQQLSVERAELERAKVRWGGDLQVLFTRHVSVSGAEQGAGHGASAGEGAPSGAWPRYRSRAPAHGLQHPHGRLPGGSCLEGRRGVVGGRDMARGGENQAVPGRAQGWGGEGAAGVAGGVALHPKLAHTRSSAGADLCHLLGRHERTSRTEQVIHWFPLCPS